MKIADVEWRGPTRRHPQEGSGDNTAIILPPTKEHDKSSLGKPKGFEDPTMPPKGWVTEESAIIIDTIRREHISGRSISSDGDGINKHCAFIRFLVLLCWLCRIAKANVKIAHWVHISRAVSGFDPDWFVIWSARGVLVLLCWLCGIG
jgi:hypothetical protein